jgi:biopolymer transport protein ExbB/TolQ
MIDKIKKILAFIVAPITLGLGVIFYLIRANQRLKAERDRSEAEKQLANELTKVEESKNEANQAENDYKSVRDAYLRKSSDGNSSGS